MPKITRNELYLWCSLSMAYQKSGCLYYQFGRISELGSDINELSIERKALNYNKGICMQVEKKEIYEELKRNPENVRFKVLCKAAELFGFRFRGGKGSHRIYVKDGVKEMLNFQNVKGKVKPYQVKQFLKVIERYKLLEEENV